MKIAIIGAGNMGGAIAIAAAKTGGDVVVANPSTGKLEALKAAEPRIDVTTDNIKAAEGADLVVLAVKPWILPSVVDQIKPSFDFERQSVVSIAGGVGFDALDDMFRRDNGELPAVFRVIPDTAISVARGMTFIAWRRAPEAAVVAVSTLFAAMGEAAVVEERLIDAATALSSCGIAYVFKYIQAAVQAGVELGFRPVDALRYVTATVDGAVALLKSEPGSTPQQHIDRVTTPGGMTIRGINALERDGFTAAVIDATLAPLKPR